MEAAGQDTSEAAAKISYWNKRQDDFLQQTGFKRQQSREEIAGFTWKDQKAASEQATDRYNEWAKSIGVKNSIEDLAKYYDSFINIIHRQGTREIIRMSIPYYGHSYSIHVFHLSHDFLQRRIVKRKKPTLPALG